MINTNSQKIEEILTRGVDEVIDKEHLEKELKSGRQLRIKFGIAVPFVFQLFNTYFLCIIF